jgi:predicted molibdopterin-dependent oxidoreductase YjgC
VTQVAEGMVVETRTKDVVRARRTILEMLASAVDLEEAPHLQDLLLEYDADMERFDGMERRESPVHDDNPFYLRDYNKCINCWRCVQVCAEDAQYTFMGDGMMDTTCVFCGQCVGVCPTNALKPKRQFLLEQGVDPDDIFRQTRRGGKRRKQTLSEE